MRKQAWLRRNLRCLACGGEMAPDGDWRCVACERIYPMHNRAVSFIDAELAAKTKVDAANQISDHPYNVTANAVLSAVQASDGMALDCGAGFRGYTSDHLVQVEITPYDNIDVMAVNQHLPFADASFDAVISLDVLEHVSDPFASARELTRVLKPGGVLYIDVPFLQMEHGYPHHYFNMTRAGLRQLFEGLLECNAHVVPRSGHPAHVVWTILHAFRRGLPAAERLEFERLTVAEILAMGHANLRDVYEGALSDEMTWKIASTTQAFFTKPWDQGGNRLGLQPNEIGSFKPYKRRRKALVEFVPPAVRKSRALHALRRIFRAR